MQSFEKLLESVRSTNPDLISEEAANEMLSQYNAGIEQMKADALADGQALGFKEGYDQGKRIAADEAKKSYDALVEKLDQEATEKLKSVLDMMNEEHAQKLEQVYNQLKASTIPVYEFKKFDQECCDKLQQVADAITTKCDNYATVKLESVEKKLNKKLEDREAFLNKKHKASKMLLESKLEEAKKLLSEQKERKLKILSEQVEKYLNYALQSKIPTKQLISEQKYNASLKTIEKITSLLKINNIIQESKDGIFNDYENQIKAQKEVSNKLILENSSLKAKLNKQEAVLLLESKLQKCVPAEAAFLRNYFKNADTKQIIEEQIEDARAVFKRLHDEKRKALVKEHAKTTKVVPSNVVSQEKKQQVKKQEPVKKVVTESVKAQAKPVLNGKPNFIAAYAEMLKNNN